MPGTDPDDEIYDITEPGADDLDEEESDEELEDDDEKEGDDPLANMTPAEAYALGATSVRDNMMREFGLTDDDINAAEIRTSLAQELRSRKRGKDFGEQTEVDLYNEGEVEFEDLSEGAQRKLGKY